MSGANFYIMFNLV